VKSISFGVYEKYPVDAILINMQTVQETRKSRLILLKKKYGRWVDLNLAIGWEKTNPRLSQIYKGTLRSDRNIPYAMGDETAREIEVKLGLPIGWMDTPATYDEILGSEDQRAKVLQLMEAMPPDQWATVVRLVDALSQPVLKDGTKDSF
jgi:hypothetical protein